MELRVRAWTPVSAATVRAHPGRSVQPSPATNSAARGHRPAAVVRGGRLDVSLQTGCSRSVSEAGRRWSPKPVARLSFKRWTGHLRNSTFGAPARRSRHGERSLLDSPQRWLPSDRFQRTRTGATDPQQPIDVPISLPMSVVRRAYGRSPDECHFTGSASPGLSATDGRLQSPALRNHRRPTGRATRCPTGAACRNARGARGARALGSAPKGWRAYRALGDFSRLPKAGRRSPAVLRTGHRKFPCLSPIELSAFGRPP